MNVRLFISLIFIVAISGLSVIPVRHHFYAGAVAPLPPHHTYQTVFSETLPAAINGEAEKHGCRGYVIPVAQVDGDGALPASVVDDVNLALASYSGWKLRVDETLKKKMIRRVDERFKAWGPMGVGPEMVELLEAQKSVSMGTRYSVKAKYYGITHGGDDIKLVVTVNDEKLQSRLFEIPVTFINPSVLAELVKGRDEKLSDAAALAKKSVLCLWGVAGISALFMIYLLFVAAGSVARFRKGRKYRAYLVQEIGKREELVKKGHFVTACELADRYLTAFPGDTDVKAFRRRLLDFTNNDPEKAQLAYVEWKKLRDASRQLEIVLSELRAGHIRGARVKLKKLLAEHSGFEEADELDRQLRAAPEGKFIIRKSGNGLHAEVFCNPVVTVGRKDAGICPDIVIDDRRVSRKHLSITIDGGRVVVEDSGSMGGTFVNGDKIIRRELHDGDLLTLSKVIHYEVRLFREENGKTGGMFLKGKGRHIFVVETGIGFDFETGSVRCPGQMISVIKREGVTVLSTPQETILPEEGRRFRANAHSFIVEALASGGPAGG